MARSTSKPDPRGRELTVATAEIVFGWKNVHNHNGELLGKKQDKLGRWRSARVPDYSNDPSQAYAIDERMKHLRCWDQYMKELSKLTRSKNLPLEWATPEQRGRAAITVLRRKR